MRTKHPAPSQSILEPCFEAELGQMLAKISVYCHYEKEDLRREATEMSPAKPSTYLRAAFLMSGFGAV